MRKLVTLIATVLILEIVNWIMSYAFHCNMIDSSISIGTGALFLIYLLVQWSVKWTCMYKGKLDLNRIL